MLEDAYRNLRPQLGTMGTLPWLSTPKETFLACIRSADNEPKSARQDSDRPKVKSRRSSRGLGAVRIARRFPARVEFRLGLLIWLLVASPGTPANADETGVHGFWQEPSGAVIQIAPCTEGLCLKIVALSPGN